MAFDSEPIVHNWYRHLDKGQKFEVIALDEDEGVVEIQHFDGDVEELDLDSWYQLDIEAIETPEDWTGPIDDVERDDLGYTETDMESEDWTAPLREVSPQGTELEPEEPQEGTPTEEPWSGDE